MRSDSNRSFEDNLNLRRERDQNRNRRNSEITEKKQLAAKDKKEDYEIRFPFRLYGSGGP